MIKTAGIRSQGTSQIANCETCIPTIRLMNVNIAFEYWRDRALTAEHRQMELDSDLTQARCRSGRVSAENVAIAQAASALLVALGDETEHGTLIANLHTALECGYTQSMASAASNAVSVHVAASVIRRMLAKMKTREQLARAAEKWALEQMLRKRLSIERIEPWAVGGYEIGRRK